jgi:hypothetical protein
MQAMAVEVPSDAHVEASVQSKLSASLSVSASDAAFDVVPVSLSSSASPPLRSATIAPGSAAEELDEADEEEGEEAELMDEMLSEDMLAAQREMEAELGDVTERAAFVPVAGSARIVPNLLAATRAAGNADLLSVGGGSKSMQLDALLAKASQ